MAVVLAEATTLKVTIATFTTPVGPVRLLLWKAEMFVVPGMVVFDCGVSAKHVIGVPFGSVHAPPVPPATLATVTTLGSYVSVIA